MNVQNPSSCFSMSAFGPLQKLTRTLLASGALKRICTRELLSTRGYCALRTLDEAGLKSLASCARQKLASSAIRNAVSLISPPTISAVSCCPDLHHSNGPGLQVNGEFPGVVYRAAYGFDCIRMLERCSILKPGAHGVQRCGRL